MILSDFCFRRESWKLWCLFLRCNWTKEVHVEMASKAVKWFKHDAWVWQTTNRQTDRPRYGKLCGYTGNYSRYLLL